MVRSRAPDDDDDEVATRSDNSTLESLDPIPPSERTWTAWTYTAMWAGISVQPSSFIFGAALLGLGLSVAEAAVALVLGNILLVIPLVLNAFPGAKYGIPFPVLVRSVFGLRGAPVAVLLRGIVGVGWCGFNLWLGGLAFAEVVRPVVSSAASESPPPGGISPLQGGCMAVFTLIHLAAIWAGVGRLQPLLRVSPAIQSAGALALTIWIFSVATFDELIAATEELRHEAKNENSRVVRVLVGATAACSGWSTLALNIADLSRFAASQDAVIWGQLFMFPIANIGCPLVGALALGATRHCYGTGVTTTSWNLTAMFQYGLPPPPYALFYHCSSLGVRCSQTPSLLKLPVSTQTVHQVALSLPIGTANFDPRIDCFSC